MHIPPLIATIIYVAGIVGLFWLDREPEACVSTVLWIPTTWLLITGSRPVSMWLGMSPTAAKGDVYLEGSPIDRVVYLALLIAGLIVLHERVEQVGPLLRMNGPTLLFFSYAALSILWSDYPFVTFKHWIKGIGDVVMGLIIVTEPDSLGAIKRIITRLGFLLLPLSVLFIKYYPRLGRTLTNSWTMQATGVTTQKNQLGIICLIYGLVFLWSSRAAYRNQQDPNRPRRLLAYGTMLGMVAWLLWRCDSKTSMCGLVIAGGLMLLICRASLVSKRAIVHLLVLGVLGLSLFALFFDSGGGLVQSLGRETSLTGRTTVWAMVLSMHTNPWLGTGYETFWLGNRLQELQEGLPGFPVNEAHNGYLEIYLNLGWIGISLLALLLLTGYRRVIAKFRQDPEAGSLLLGLLLATVVVSFSEAGFRMMTTSWFFLLFAVFATSQASPHESLGQTGVNAITPCAEARREFDGVCYTGVC